MNLKAKFGLNYFKNSYEFLDAGDYIYWMRMGYKNAYMGDMKHPDGSAVKAWSSLSSLTSATPYGTGNAYFASDGVTPLDGNKTSSAIWSTRNILIIWLFVGSGLANNDRPYLWG